jgi:hypothetical protein
VTNSDGTIIGIDASGNRTLVSSAALNSNLSTTLDGIACDAYGNLYITDEANNRVFKIDPNGVGSIYGTITKANGGVAIDSKGNLFVAAGSYKAGGAIVASGVYEVNFLGDTANIFPRGTDSLTGIATDSADNIYVCDNNVHTIYEINASGNIPATFSTGVVEPRGVTASDGTVRATLDTSNEVVQYDQQGGISDLPVYLISPSGITDDGVGNIYAADRVGNSIAHLDTSGHLSTYAGSGLAGPKYLQFGPAITAPLITISPHTSPAPFENAGNDSITVTRSGPLSQTSTVLLQTADVASYSPQLLHHGFFDNSGSMTPSYYSTNDAQFQDALRALPGRDYQPVSMTLTFAPNETAKMVNIPMINNNAADGRRRLLVSLTPETAPLTVGPDLVETIIDDDAIAEIVDLSNLQSTVNSNGTRTFSASLKVLNVSPNATGPVRVRLFGHGNFVNPPNPAPSPPPDVDFGITPVIVSQSLLINGSATATFNNVTIPAPTGNAYGYNTWYWLYAAVEQQAGGNWTATAAPFLVIDGVRLVSGYINSDGTATPRDLWSGGGVDTGTPGTTVGGNGDAGLITGTGVSPSPTPAIPGLNPFHLDGQPDFPGSGAAGSGYQQLSTGPKLYAAVRQASGRTLLYIATQSPGSGGDSTSKDIFVFVTDQLLGSATQAAPWGKTGRIACATTKPFLGGESRDDYLAWYNCGNGAQSVKLNTTTGVMEGVLDLGSAFGSVPQVLYLAAAAYGTLNGGNLMSQTPTGNGDANIDPNEFLPVPVAALVDENADGKYDRLDPASGFVLTGQRTVNGQPNSTGNDFTLTWPAYPGKMYQVYSKNSLTDSWQAVTNALFTAPSTPPFMDTLSYTDLNAIPSGHRFYKVQIQ